MRKRTRSREIVLQVLYQLEIRGTDVIDEVDAFCIEQGKEPEVSDFAIKLVRGCIQEIKEIDKKCKDVIIEEVTKEFEHTYNLNGIIIKKTRPTHDDSKKKINIEIKIEDI